MVENLQSLLPSATHSISHSQSPRRAAIFVERLGQARSSSIEKENDEKREKAERTSGIELRCDLCVCYVQRLQDGGTEEREEEGELNTYNPKDERERALCVYEAETTIMSVQER